MFQWWSWYILLSSVVCSFQARSVIDIANCPSKSPGALIPEHCILKCVQRLYDHKWCTVCESKTDNGDDNVNFVKNEEALVDKRLLEWCSDCGADQIANFFNSLDMSWCNDALHLDEYEDLKELHRTKRYNPGIGGAHSYPRNPSYSQIGKNMVVAMIIFGIFLLCALFFFCKIFAKNDSSQESYQIND